MVTREGWFYFASLAAIAVMMAAGASDPIVPYAGGRIANWGTKRRGYLAGVEELFNFWRAHNGCSSVQTAGGEAPDGLPLFADGARSARIVDAVLASGASVVMVGHLRSDARIDLRARLTAPPGAAPHWTRVVGQGYPASPIFRFKKHFGDQMLASALHPRGGSTAGAHERDCCLTFAV